MIIDCQFGINFCKDQSPFFWFGMVRHNDAKNWTPNAMPTVQRPRPRQRFVYFWLQGIKVKPWWSSKIYLKFNFTKCDEWNLFEIKNSFDKVRKLFFLPLTPREDEREKKKEVIFAKIAYHSLCIFGFLFLLSSAIQKEVYGVIW